MFSAFDSRLSVLEKLVSDLQERNLLLERQNEELKTEVKCLSSAAEKQFILYEKIVPDLCKEIENSKHTINDSCKEVCCDIKEDCELFIRETFQKFSEEIKKEISHRHGNVLIGLFRPFHYYVELPFFVNKHISYTDFLNKIRQITPQSRDGFTFYIDSLSEFININKIDLADFPSRKICFENSLTGYRHNCIGQGDWQNMSFETKHLLYCNFSKCGIQLLYNGVVIEM